MTDYDFINSDQPERKREVQRRVELTESNDKGLTSDKVPEADDEGLVQCIKQWVKRLL